MTFGWSSEATSSDSRRNLLRKSSSCASSGEITFSATLRPSRSWVARKTVPIPPRPSNDSIVYPPNVCPTPGASRSLIGGTRVDPVAAPSLVLDQVCGAERLELSAELPDEPGELGSRVHRLVGPDRVHELLVRAQSRCSSDRGVPLGHVAHEEVRLGANLDLVPFLAPYEDEASLSGVVVQALGSTRAEHGDGGCPCRLRVAGSAEDELEITAFSGVGERREDADGVAVPERGATGHALELVASPYERAVDTRSVEDEPPPALALQRAVGDACHETLRIRLQSDVVRAREPSHRHPLAGQS